MYLHDSDHRLLPVVAFLFLAAPLTAQSGALGQIDFPTSGQGKAQEHFLEGVLYLHSFEFDDAREEFQKASQLDPGFAMAYWGEALTYNHPLWKRVDLAAGRAALDRLAMTAEGRADKAPTQKEKDFLATLEALFGTGEKSERDRAYHDALQAMHRKYPDDLEVASFYALSILGLSDGVRDFRNYMRAASIVEEVFDRNPRHPGAAHYLIHSYDDPTHAPLGLRAARVYAGIAPDASHAQHMISHIYVALGQWDEASAANEKAWAVSQARVKRKGLGVEEHDFHSFHWLHYSYLQQGRYREAHAMLGTMHEAHEMAEHSGRMGNYHGGMRAQQVIETQDWNTSLPPAGHSFSDQFAAALIAIHTGNLEQARSILQDMQADGGPHAVMGTELRGLLQLREGNRSEALELLRQAAAEEDAMPLSYGPPMPSKPTHELLGEVLLELGQAAEAQAEFEKALDRAPRRASSLLGLLRASRLAGDSETAQETYATLKSIWHRADPDVLKKLEASETPAAGGH